MVRRLTIHTLAPSAEALAAQRAMWVSLPHIAVLVVVVVSLLAIVAVLLRAAALMGVPLGMSLTLRIHVGSPAILVLVVAVFVLVDLGVVHIVGRAILLLRRIVLVARLRVEGQLQVS